MGKGVRKAGFGVRAGESWLGLGLGRRAGRQAAAMLQRQEAGRKTSREAG